MFARFLNRVWWYAIHANKSCTVTCTQGLIGGQLRYFVVVESRDWMRLDDLYTAWRAGRTYAKTGRAH
jgi:hypothetical protein